MTKHWMVLATASLAMLIATSTSIPIARADIFQWEYVNPANPNQGKQPSTMLAPDGAGANAVPSAILSNRNLTMAYLIDANLSGAHAGNTNLTNADLRHANLTTASFIGETENDYFIGSNLDGANLSEANLTGVSLGTSTLMSANLSQANLTGAYLAGNIFVSGGDEGAVAYFPGTDLTDANLSGANLTNANLSGICYLFDCALGANFSGANLTGADARGANFQYAILADANTSNLIQSNGHIAGLDLTAGALLVLRDYDGNPAVPAIVVDQNLALNGTGTLRLVFDADTWGSTISFAPGIPVALGGTLELTFDAGVSTATQIGRTIDLFDWTGMARTGAFTVSSPYSWNLSNLYTTGEVTLTALAAIPGDFNHNGVVDAADYVVWRKNPGGIYTPDDYTAWRTHFGQTLFTGSGSAFPGPESTSSAVPEPCSLLLLAIALAMTISLGRGAAGNCC